MNYNHDFSLSGSANNNHYDFNMKYNKNPGDQNSFANTLTYDNSAYPKQPRKLPAPNNQQFWPPQYAVQYPQFSYPNVHQQSLPSTAKNVIPINYSSQFSYPQPPSHSQSSLKQHHQNVNNFYLPINSSSTSFQTSSSEIPFEMFDKHNAQNMRINSSENHVTKPKRIKISYNCVECRRRRVKCDKKYPCESCTKKEVDCVYDTQSQQKPKRYNKDSIIQRLSNQMNFYKQLALKYTPKEKFSVFSKDFEDIHDVIHINDSAGFGKSDINNLVLPLFKEQGIDFDFNFFFNHNFLEKYYFIDEVFEGKGLKRDAKIKTENDQIFAALLETAFQNAFQKEQATKYVELIKLEYYKKKPDETSLRSCEMFVPFSSDQGPFTFVEDEVVDKPSLYLSKIIDRVNSILPSYQLLKKLKIFYHSNIYFVIPCLEIEVLDNYIKDILRVDVITDKVTLNLKGSDIKNKLANLSNIFSILVLANTVMPHDENTEKETLNPLILETAINLIVTSKPLSEPTLHKLSAISQLWTVLTLLPDSYSKINPGFGKNMELLSFFIRKMAIHERLSHNNTALMTTDVDKLKMEDIWYINHCKKLALTTAIITIIEKIGGNPTAVPFKISYIKEFETFLKENKSDNDFDKCILTIAYKKLQFFVLIDECYNLFSESIDLALLPEKVSEIELFVDNNCKIKNWKAAIDKDVTVLHDGVATINVNLITNKFSFDVLCFSKITILKLYHVSTCALKQRLIDDHSEENKNLFFDYYFKTFQVAFESLALLNNFSTGKLELFIGKIQSHDVTSATNSLYTKSLLIVLQFICRIYAYRIYLYAVISKNKDDKELGKDLELTETTLKFLNKVFCASTHHYSKKYRFQYYNSFKLFLFFDFFKRIYSDDSLFNYLFKTKEKFNINNIAEESILNNNLLKDMKFCPTNSQLYINMMKMITAFDVSSIHEENIEFENTNIKETLPKTFDYNKEFEISDDFTFENFFSNLDFSSKLFDSDFFKS